MFRKRSLTKDSRGQSLVETALMIPLLLILILNAINFGYFLLVTLNLTSATRNGIEYAIQGSSTPANQTAPAPGTLSQTNADTVASLIAQELGAFNKNSKLTVKICSLSQGNDGQGHSKCSTSGVSNNADPEPAQGFVLNSIDVTYQFNTIVPTTAFNLVVGALPPCQASGQCRFTRHAEMRAMGS